MLMYTLLHIYIYIYTVFILSFLYCLYYSLEGLAKREQVAYEQAGKNIAATNTGVDSSIQLLFEKMLFLYPCKWNGDSIIVLDSFRIDPPYDAVVQKAGTAGDSAGMAQVTRTVSVYILYSISYIYVVLN